MSTISLKIETLQLHASRKADAVMQAIGGYCCGMEHIDNIRAGFEQAFVKLREHAPDCELGKC